ncbi:MAG: phage portal protein [Solobacterium sp.]|nr:phage portal protein [Solobacterium sp.]
MSVFSGALRSLAARMDTSERTIEIGPDSDIMQFIDADKANELALYTLALHTGVSILANSLSKCEFRTYLWKASESRIIETFGEEYYLWNYEPNRNENASAFIFKLVSHLIYDGECLVIPTSRGDLLIADTYRHNKNAMISDTFEQVCISRSGEPGNGSPFYFRERFKAEDVLFFRLNNRNLSDLLGRITADYDELMKNAMEQYYKQGGERGVVTLTANAPNGKYGTKADGTPRTFTDVYNDMMTNQFREYFKNPNAVVTMFDGFKYERKAEQGAAISRLSDVTGITDEIYERVATALQIPPAILKGDVADVEVVTENLITFGIDPIAKMIETEINRKRYGKRALKGSRIIVDTSTIKHADAFSVASSADKMIACGAWSIDDVRRKANDMPLGEEWSSRHFMTKNYASMNDMLNENDPEAKEENDETGTAD